jgi:hypothetical protein
MAAFLAGGDALAQLASNQTHGFGNDRVPSMP